MMERPGSKVLFISYPFPPMGGSGVQRTVKFAKYLPKFGWEPIILTVKAPKQNQSNEYDPTLLNDFPHDLRVYRTICLDLNTIWGTFFWHNNGVGSQQMSTQRERSKCGNRSNTKHLLKIVKSLLNTWAFIPDDKIGWLPFAVVKALQIIRDCNVDLIYSTSNPYTDHLIGAIVKRFTRKPWIADFRDPWTDNIYHSNRYYRGRFGWMRKAIDTRLEQYILNAADCVVTTTEQTKDSLFHKSSQESRAKFFAITNGFDLADFYDLHPKRVSQSFTIVYNGSFRRDSPEIFMMGFKQALMEDKLDVHLVFAGNVGKKYEELIDKIGLRSHVYTMGYLQHKDSLSFVFGADLLLLILNSDLRAAEILPAKLFEYMASRKPILAVVPEGAVANIVREMELGCVVSPDNPDEIAKTIRALYEKHSMGKLKVSKDVDLEPFERHFLTSKLAGVFHSLINRQRVP